MKKLMVFLKKLKNLVENQLKNPFWWAKSGYIRYYDQLPLDEYGILLESEHGKKLDGNIFYLLRYLASSEKYAPYRIYLSATGRNVQRFKQFLSEHGIDRVEVVMLASDKYMQLLASVKYLVNDTTFAPYYVKKDGQIYLNTWHGTPLKALGRSDKSEPHAMGNVQKNFVCSDFLLFPNEYTKECILKDYMLENISEGRTIYGGYPRNEAFFDLVSAERIRKEQELQGKRIYAYMPTYRSGAGKRGYVKKGDAYLLFFLYELDKKLQDDEILFANLHPLSRSKVDFGQFEHIRPFPNTYETYEFLSIADALVTDYSSVFFDFSCTGRKLVLFPYDKEDYLASRGMYLSMDELPFPQVETVDALIRELRAPKQYNDQDFIDRFCPWDGPDASQKLCDYVILGDDTGLHIEAIPNNRKENVLLYVGNLAGNGITASMRALFDVIDLEKRNYYITFVTEYVRANYEVLFTLPKEISFYPTTGDLNLTIGNRIVRKLFKWKIIPASFYVTLLKKRIQQDYKRNFGSAKFDAAIQFNGYDQEIILRFSVAPCKKAIFVHSDMLAEIKMRKNQRRDVLRYAYRHYDKVAVVTKGILTPTYKIAGQKDNICIVKNAIRYEKVLEMAKKKLALDELTECSVEREEFFNLMADPCPKFISVGRFSPEKGHRRLVDAFYEQQKQMPKAKLVIMGGSSYKKTYDELREYILSLGLEKSVILLCRVSNPYPIIKACDYFILSSFYEGFGLVLMEADILGKPVVSTDIPGPRDFMLAHGGTLVENSEEGILNGIKMLAEGKVHPLNVDYEAYNQEVIQEFEQLFE